MKKILTLIMFAICINNMAFAETFFEEGTLPIFQRIDREDGLNNFSVSNVLQDKNGYIWFGTQGGLFKYNGDSTIAYRNDPFEIDGLINNLIQTMYYDEEKHALWLGTYQGVSMLDISSNKFTNYTMADNGLSNNVVTAIAKDKLGNLWFGTLGGLNRLDLSTGKFVIYPVEGDVVRSLLLDTQGRLLVGTHEGLCIFDEGLDRLEKVTMEYPSPYVMMVREFKPGVITIGMWDGGVLELDMDFNILKHHLYDDNRVYTIHRTHDSTLWVGTWGGGLFAEKNDEVFKFPGTGESGDIGHGVVYALFEDERGVLWIGTNGGAAYKADPREGNYLAFYNEPDDPSSLDSGKMNAIYRDDLGRLWVAIYNKGLNRYDEKLDEMIKYNSSNKETRILPNDQVMDFIEVDNKFYIASGAGLCVYNSATDSFDLLDILPEEMITNSIAVDYDGEFWLGTYTNGVYHLDKDMKIIKQFNANNIDYKLSDNLIYDMLVDSKSQIWIATNNGLNVYDKEKDALKSYYKEEGNHSALASSNMRRIFEDSKNQLWVAMHGGGVAKFNEENETFINFTEADGMLDNSVLSIHESNSGMIWIATHGGVSILDPENYSITHITGSTIIENENYTGSGWSDEDGSIYLGGINGITHFPADFNSHADYTPNLFITDVLEYNTSISQEKENFNDTFFEFEHDQNYISFEFEALNYSSKSEMQYFYQLSGVDVDWVDSKQRKFASYSNLNPGSYIFKVKAKTLNGEYTEPVQVSFTIAKPWYKTRAAYVVYGLLFLFMIYLILRIRESHLIAERNSELAKINDKLEEAVNELEHVSIKDPLTGIYNRRYLDTVLHDHLELAKRGDNYLSLLMVDIDDFKLVNDKYGHVAGDHFLIAFASVLEKQLLRNTDFVARYGGDEFAIVLYDTDPSGTSILADRVLNEIRSTEMLGGVDFKGSGTSVSIGVYSVKPARNITMEDFIAKADAALYEAKTSGKNRVIIHD